ncbi:2-hydroxymuconate tautomerase [Ammoniphilus resinae]|uniref:Tautomerase n=1 Tax=Ammoniphilus resinae TaxID=861532 RepID=A0ABS4GW50_9BACL|nr:4-oxalocrotonate tautomerase [Ammoniphilus resinae]
MPFITVKVLEGKTEDQKRKLVEKVTEAVCESFDVDPSVVFIFIEDLEKNNYGKKGKLFSDL